MATQLSIITINYNNIGGLQKTFDSVFEQSCKDFEYIIIDGGSTDDSKTLIENYANKFVYWISEKDNGIYDAMNKGIKVAKGEYLLFLNSGDTLYDGNVLCDFFKMNFTEDIIYGNVYLEKSRQTRKYPETITFRFLFENAFCHQAMSFKKSLFEKNGLFNTDFKIVADWLFYSIAIVKNNASTKYFDRTISNFNENGLSSLNGQAGSNERVEAINTYFSLYKEDYHLLSKAERRLYEYKSSRLVEWVMKLQASSFYKRIRNFGRIKN